ncbi:uncharacterized protein LOC109195772 isoform X2 [Oreochromis niloticus]|uniref:uncharacterized protein LOC109195772 isoform X2 n=1 Tax=Oreochromis niloticus TaxID=8128 RepID=UPI0009048C9C|nr:uncharacterized protein LOC109195772 isoform X2 [Oreochromis niloticus]CAI5697275.1 unnamed protein product [Mustela putorius furo]
MIYHAKKLLTKGILNVMTCAEEHKFSSVAIPAVSSGIFNFPVSICADVVVTTIKKYNEHKNPTSPPFEIHLVNNDDPTVKEMERAFKEILLEPLSDVRRTGPEDSPSTLERTEHLERNTTGVTKDTASQVIESLLHHWAIRLNLGNNIYIMNHYTSGVILYGERELIRRQSLSKVNFDNYRAILSFVNIGNVHWKFLYINADDSCLYLVDPSRNSLEQEESDRAAKRFREYFKMRRTCYNKTDWVNVRLRGVLTHPCQRDGSSCGVMVIMMAKAVMEAFPNKPEMTFLMTKKEMAQARRTFAQTILEASVFDSDTMCHVCNSETTQSRTLHH